MKTKASIPKLVELAFDGLYLVTAVLLGLGLLVGAGSPARLLWGTMALTLAFGDSFHLLPRMLATCSPTPQRFTAAMGWGKLITSLTMTLFYLLLWHCGLLALNLSLPLQTAVLYLLAAVRILLCLLPRNQWQLGGLEPVMGIYRNIPFFLQGLMVLWLYAAHAAALPGLGLVWLAVLLSFACYLPVVLWVHKNPRLGMLMLPKTCAYLWLIAIGFWL